MRRNLAVVIDQMIAAIPHSENNLILDLKERKQSFNYAAPESRQLWWEQTTETLALHIDTDKPTPWQQSVINIWMNK